MNQDEAIIARRVRRELEKYQIDISLIVISCHRTKVTIAGSIRAPRANPYSRVRDEMDAFHRAIMRAMPEIREIIFECRIPATKIRDKEDDAAVVDAGKTTVNPHHRPGMHH